jgi:hypothetical protein
MHRSFDMGLTTAEGQKAQLSTKIIFLKAPKM